MSLKNEYNISNDLAIRVPLKPIVTSFTKDSLLATFKLKEVKEAIYLSSPEFYQTCLQYFQTGVNSEEFEQKLMISLMKYMTRLHSRCTPFGLFAGCTMVSFGKKDNLRLQSHLSKRNTRLDSSLADNLFEKIASTENINERCSYKPNTSIYRYGTKIRYVETYFRKGRKKYRLASVDNSVYLQKILRKAEMAESTQYDLAKEIVDENITFKDAKNFIHELIKASVLVSEIELSLSGQNFLIQISDILNNIVGTANNDAAQHYLKLIIQIQNSLRSIDEKIGNEIELYHAVNNLLSEIGLGDELKHIFQVDMFPSFSEDSQLNECIKKDLYTGLDALMAITPKDGESELEQFIKRFESRYADREIPLLKALDGEIGVGYGYSRNHNIGLTPLVGDLRIPGKIQDEKIKWEAVDKFLFHKIRDAHESKLYSVQLNLEELDRVRTTKHNLPDTTAVMFKLVCGNKSKTQILLNGTLGSSAVNPLGRFGTGNNDIAKVIKRVTAQEENFNPNQIVAEIIHFPEDNRAGTVLLRPDIRSYQIPYLSKSNKDISNQIHPSDLKISVRNNRVYLRSVKLNKEILPRLTTAHNYASESLPVYHFLCDLQLQEKQSGLYFDWGKIAEEFIFLPRVTVGNVILSEAKWQFEKKHLSFFETKKLSLKEIANFREEWNVPDLVLLQQGSNELLVNLKNELSIEMFKKIIRKKKRIVLKEFLFDKEKAIVRDENDNGYTNEFIAFLEKRVRNQDSVIRDNKRGTNNLAAESDRKNDVVDFPVRNFSLGSEWMYYKVYCGTRISDQILIDAIKPLTEILQSKKLIDSWFFIRYADPDTHLRIRFHLNDLKKVGEVISRIANKLNGYEETGLIWQLQTETYQREIERYGKQTIHLVEKYFHHDSDCIIKMLSGLSVSKENIKWKFAFKAVDSLLDNFKFTVQQKMNFMEDLKTSYASEFNCDKFLKIQMDKKYRKLRKEIDSAMFYGVFENEKSLIMLIEERTEKTRKLISEITERNLLEPELDIESVVASITHMMLNRIFNTKQRIHEMVIYDFMWRTYRSAIAQSKQPKSS